MLPHEELTPREMEVLLLIGIGLMNKEIGNVLNIEENTVVGHTHNIYKKLGVDSRTQAAIYTWRHGLVTEIPMISCMPKTSNN
jgi:NarL family two-component system response regulator LiaR